MYLPGLPTGWTPLDPPSFRAVRGSLEPLRQWLLTELRAREEPVLLAGHSMGGALALLAAAAEPARVGRLVLFSPAGLPIRKPVRASVRDLVSQTLAGSLPPGSASAALRFVRAPASAMRLARAVRALELSRELRAVRDAGIPTTVIGCTTDTLVTRRHCRRIASAVAGDYRELELPGGHVWMFRSWQQFAAELVACQVASTEEAGSTSTGCSFGSRIASSAIAAARAAPAADTRNIAAGLNRP
jgi:pimeloyl-ACP methyl ester carboxylesterase